MRWPSPRQEETIWAHYRGNPRNTYSRGNKTQSRSGHVLSQGHPFAYLPQETCRRKHRTQCNSHFCINEFSLPNVNHIKCWMTDLTSKNTPKNISSWSRNGRRRYHLDRYPLNPAKSRIAGGRGRMAIKGRGGHQERRSKKILGRTRERKWEES